MIGPSSRRLALLLAASVLLNVFALAFLIGRYSARHHPADHPAASDHDPSDHDPGDHGRATMRRLWRERREVLGPHHRRLREARLGVREALATEPLDRAALDAALAELRAATSASQEALHGVIVDAAPALPAAERVPLAELAGPGRRRGHGRGHGQGALARPRRRAGPHAARDAGAAPRPRPGPPERPGAPPHAGAPPKAPR